MEPKSRFQTDSLDFNYNNLTVPFVLRDTVKSTGEIREVTINVYKTAFLYRYDGTCGQKVQYGECVLCCHWERLYILRNPLSE